MSVVSKFHAYLRRHDPFFREGEETGVYQAFLSRRESKARLPIRVLKPFFGLPTILVLFHIVTLLASSYAMLMLPSIFFIFWAKSIFRKSKTIPDTAYELFTAPIPNTQLITDLYMSGVRGSDILLASYRENYLNVMTSIMWNFQLIMGALAFFLILLEVFTSITIVSMFITIACIEIILIPSLLMFTRELARGQTLDCLQFWQKKKTNPFEDISIQGYRFIFSTILFLLVTSLVGLLTLSQIITLIDDPELSAYLTKEGGFLLLFFLIVLVLLILRLRMASNQKKSYEEYRTQLKEADSRFVGYARYLERTRKNREKILSHL